MKNMVENTANEVRGQKKRGRGVKFLSFFIQKARISKKLSYALKTAIKPFHSKENNFFSTNLSIRYHSKECHCVNCHCIIK